MASRRKTPSGKASGKRGAPVGAQGAPKKRTQLSGYQKRERARLKKAEAAPHAAEFADLYREIGAPPADGAQRVEWGNRISATIAYEQLVAPEIRQPSERRLVLEAVRTLGMTAVKAIYEERLKRLESKVYKRAGKDADAGAELEESD